MITLFKPFALSILLFLFSQSLQAAEKFIIDDQHSYVLWHIKHLGFSTQTGKWYVKGNIILDKEHPENSQVEANIKIADMVTGLPELDKHLKDKSFFNAEKYPQATFVSNKVEIVGKDSAKVRGMLNLLGVSKPIILNVTLNKVGKSPINDKTTVGFSATTKIKPADFGMNMSPALGDEVKIDIEVEATQAEGAKK